MTAMGAEDRVRFVQMRTDPRGDGLLADVGVTGSVDETLLVGFGEPFLHHADGEHGAVERER
jgi:hypothetical protein